MDYVQGGSFLDWSKTMDEMLKLDFDTVIPGHGPVSTRADVVKFKTDLETMRTRVIGLIKEGKTKPELAKILEDDYGWRSTGCPPSPPTAGCLQYQQLDALIAPSMSPAWPTDLVLGDHFVGAGYGAAAVAGYPSLSVPMGDSHGMPLGIVFMGPAWSEPRLIELGYAFEQLSKARKPPQFLPTLELTTSIAPAK